MSRIHRIFTNDSKKAFDKAQHSFLIKVLEALGIDRKYLKIINTIYNKFIASTVCKQSGSISSESRNRLG